jgi:hypothetical protein
MEICDKNVSFLKYKYLQFNLSTDIIKEYGGFCAPFTPHEVCGKSLSGPFPITV